MNKNINFKSLAFHLLVPIMLLFIISMLVPEYIDYYKTLDKPFLDLPSYIFFGLYSLMYLVFGIAAYLVEESEGTKKKAFNYYYAALLLNLLYIPVIFGTGELMVGFIWSAFLAIFVFLTYTEFKKINKTSGIMLIIYLIYSVFLGYYSLMIYILNR